MDVESPPQAFQPGDIDGGHTLGSDGVWHQLGQSPPRISPSGKLSGKPSTVERFRVADSWGAVK